MAFRQLLVSAKPAICGAMGVGAGMAFPQAVLADKKGDKDPGRPMFDPEALERGAAALREINKSPYAKQGTGAYEAVRDAGERSTDDGACCPDEQGVLMQGKELQVMIVARRKHRVVVQGRGAQMMGHDAPMNCVFYSALLGCWLYCVRYIAGVGAWDWSAVQKQLGQFVLLLRVGLGLGLEDSLLETN
eukprot:1155359-Pelagomonas_calceolata.AAC.7